MPYVITTRGRRQHPLDFKPVKITRRAVATLEEVRGELEEAVFEITGKPVAATIPESGGTVGPLPDGTVIEVKHTTWPALSAAATCSPTSNERVRIIDAYNAEVAS